MLNMLYTSPRMGHSPIEQVPWNAHWTVRLQLPLCVWGMRLLFVAVVIVPLIFPTVRQGGVIGVLMSFPHLHGHPLFNLEQITRAVTVITQPSLVQSAPTWWVPTHAFWGGHLVSTLLEMERGLHWIRTCLLSPHWQWVRSLGAAWLILADFFLLLASQM